MIPDSNSVKESHLAILIKMIQADGKVDLAEQKYLDDTARKLGFKESQVDAISENPDSYINDLPATYSERLVYFYNLLFLMGIDNKITSEERELCKQVGMRLCFNPMMMDELIHILSKNLGKQVPADDIVDTVKKYFN